MSRRNNWNAVRMVADNIEAGDRSYWNLTKIPDLPTSGHEAIRELEEKGLVKASWRDDRVEPTDTFWPWLKELQSAETAQSIARQKALLPPWQVPVPAPAASKPAAVVPAVTEPSSQPSIAQPSVTKTRATSKFRRARVKRPAVGITQMSRANETKNKMTARM